MSSAARRASPHARHPLRSVSFPVRRRLPSAPSAAHTADANYICLLSNFWPPAASALRRRKYGQCDLRALREGRLSERGFGAGVLRQLREGKEAPGRGLGKSAEPVSPDFDSRLLLKSPKFKCAGSDAVAAAGQVTRMSGCDSKNDDGVNERLPHLRRFVPHNKD